MKKLPPRRARQVMIESLETRQLLSFSTITPIPDVNGSEPASINLAGRYADGGTMVKLQFGSSDANATGNVYIELTDSITPVTVANFLNYVNSHRYDNTVVHRLVPGFVMQAGGYDTSLNHISTDAAIVNEFSNDQAAVGAGNPVNVRGTIAMAKLGSNPNSATSEWFINLADNSSNLDNQNSGFTTFGNVAGGMSIIDYIAANIPTVNGGGAFTNIPLTNYTSGFPTTANFINLLSASVASGYTYSITGNSNPSFVTPTISGSSISLAYGAAYGSSHITLTATDPAGRTINDSFDIVVPEINIADGATTLSDSQSTADNLGSPTQGQAVSKTLVISNTGTSDLTFTVPTVPSGYTITSPTDLSAVTLHPGESVNLVLSSIATNTGGAVAGTLVLNSNDPAIPAFHIPLTYTVLTRQVAVSNGSTLLTNNGSTVNFGTSSAAAFHVTLTVKNTGTGTLNLTSPTLPSGYTVFTALPSSLAAGQSANLVLAVDTTTLGTKSGNVVINSDDPNTPNFTVPVTATVSHAIISVSVNSMPVTDNQASPIDYGETNQNFPVNMIFHVVNNGDTTLTFSTATVPADFIVISPVKLSGNQIVPDLQPLAPGASVDITLSTRADTGGNKSGTFILNTSDPNIPAFHIPVTAVVHYRKLSISYNAGALSNNQSAINLGTVAEGQMLAATFHVTNTGDTLDLTNLSVTLPAGFTVVTPLPDTLAAGQSADYVLAIDSSIVGAHSGTVIFNSNDPLYALSPSGFHVPLTATVNYRRLAVTDSSNAAVATGSSADFGTVLQGDTAQKTYHISNTGNLPLTLSNLSLPNGYSLVGNFPGSIAAGASADVVVALNTLNPRGTYAGALTFSTDDPENPTFTLNLTSKLIAKGIVVAQNGVTIAYGSAATVDFGHIRQNTASQLTFTVSNSGLLPLAIQDVSLPTGYSVVQALPGTISPGTSADLIISLDTSVTGTYAGTMHIVSSDPDRPSFDIPLTAAVSLPVKIGAGGAKSVTFTDADGTHATFTFTGSGSATLDFFGGNLKSVSGKKGATVTGSGVTAGDIVLTGTSSGNSKLTVKTAGGNKSVDLGDISGTGLKMLAASSSRLVGTLSAPVSIVQLSSASGATLRLHAGTSLTVGAFTDTDITSTGNIKSLKITSFTGGSITATSIDSLAAAKSITNATFTTTKSAGTFNIKGSFQNSTLRSTGAIKSFAAVTLTGSQIYAGVDAANTPPAATPVFTGNASIGSMNIKLFINSSVAAKTLGKLNLGSVKTHNSGASEGLAATAIKSLAGKLDTGKSMKLANLNKSNLNSQLAAKKVGALNDFDILLV